MPLNEEFRKLSHRVAEATGTPGAFGIALLFIVIWLSTGPIFHFSDTWQLIINTSTTIITFLMVFLIQSAQNRDSRAIQLKLNELIRGVKGARTSLVDLEECSDEELREMQKEFHDLHVKLGTHLEERNSTKKDRRS